VTDYFLSGEIYMTGSYNPHGRKQGLFTWFYENGTKFLSGTFNNDSIAGEWNQNFRSGEPRMKFKRDSDETLILYIADADGKVLIENGNGKLKGLTLGFDPTFLIKKGELLDGKFIGKLEFESTAIGTLKKFSEEFSNLGEFIRGFVYESGEKTIYSSSRFDSEIFIPQNLRLTEEFGYYGAFLEEYPYMGNLPARRHLAQVYNNVDTRPSPPIDIEALKQKIRRLLDSESLPQTTQIQLIIESGGQPVLLNTGRELSNDTQARLIDMIKSEGLWLPGKIGGIPVRTEVSLTIYGNK